MLIMKLAFIKAFPNGFDPQRSSEEAGFQKGKALVLQWSGFGLP